MHRTHKVITLTGFQMHRTLQVQRIRLGVGGYPVPIAESTAGVGEDVEKQSQAKRQPFKTIEPTPGHPSR
jgi:hypothetical protein